MEADRQKVLTTLSLLNPKNRWLVHHFQFGGFDLMFFNKGYQMFKWSIFILPLMFLFGCSTVSQCDPVRLDKEKALEVFNKYNRNRSFDRNVDPDKLTIDIMRDGCRFVVVYTLIPAQPGGESTFLINSKLEVVHVYRGL